MVKAKRKSKLTKYLILALAILAIIVFGTFLLYKTGILK